ncbi:tyrosine-type recombinase/integrase [Massilia sp. R2A-15]|uniref:tyrosine-type recombinase/integrase n=1 Tax=Massilia sp. R2A-15 TaxID=3064278 RepID=UPI0027367E2A|nr:site-specific integrase [Massilia sp. R2A-15]WLI91181.1 tyrosine-type recombinase/integrase [Massilia sp. R2A-15]
MGTLEHFSGAERFDRAADAARTVANDRPVHAVTNATVWDACTQYVEWILGVKDGKAARDLNSRYERWVLGDPIETIELRSLNRDDVQAYRRRMVATPVTINRRGDTRLRSKSTVNRDIAAVRAALNYAYANGLLGSDRAWREPLKAFENATKRRQLYLDRDQRRRFLRSAPADLALFLQGLSLLPLRPGALAALTVADFDRRLNVLNVGRDKSGGSRSIKLPRETANLLATAAEDRIADAPLLARANGQAWNKDAWKWPLKDAAARAGLPESTTAYTLRHSVITDLVHGGLDLLTVAQISGTSVAMIEKHYGHLRGQIAADALAKLVL